MKPSRRRRLGAWTAAGLLVVLAGAVLIVRVDIAQRRQQFLAEARAAHRLLSQGASGVDAILGTLTLLDTPGASDRFEAASRRLPALHPVVLEVWRSDDGERWAAADREALAAAHASSASMSPAGRHAVLATFDADRRRYTLVLAGGGSSFAMRVDADRLLSVGEWPWRDDALVRASLRHAAKSIDLQPGASAERRPGGLTQGFEFSEPIASASQPFVFEAQQHTGPGEWPWRVLMWWSVLAIVLVAMAYRNTEMRRERRLAAERMRLAQVSRLNTLGELAAGVAHELNQPLTAVLASTQTALRVLRDERDGVPDPEGLAVVVRALRLGETQAHRAAEVVARLRRLVQLPPSDAIDRPVDLAQLSRQLVDLLSPDLAARAIEVRILGDAPPVRGDPVAVEQILHNLMTNAMHALERSANRPRTVTIALEHVGERVVCRVRDNGPGVSADNLPRLFVPFYTTRPGGLGLGLPLCQSLVLSMNGTIEARGGSPQGMEFVLDLPAASDPSEPGT